MTDHLMLPKLNKLHPTLSSTLLKIMEEAGELARAVLHFEEQQCAEDDEHGSWEGNSRTMLVEVASELLDVAQTCVTMIFVIEDVYGISAQQLIIGHLDKLKQKKYVFDNQDCYFVTGSDRFKRLRLPRLLIKHVTLLTTVCKIQEEIGELTQVLGKHAGQSGERQVWPDQKIATESLYELLDVAQCCFTMLYILEERYGLNMADLVANHIAKLRQRGYWEE